jgi:hypothetical protein
MIGDKIMKSEISYFETQDNLTDAINKLKGKLLREECRVVVDLQSLDLSEVPTNLDNLAAIRFRIIAAARDLVRCENDRKTLAKFEKIIPRYNY